MRGCKYICGVVVGLAFFSTNYAQDTCEQTLRQATNEFDAGRFYSLPSILEKCINSGFTSEQRFRAYYLLAQVYVVLNDAEKAEDSYLKLLSINPEFKPNVKDDPIDLVYMSKNFTSRPRFTPHYYLGLNTSLPTPIYRISTYSSPQVSSTHLLDIGFQLGAGMDWNISDNISIGLDGVFSKKSYLTTSTQIAVDDQSTARESSNWIDVPLYCKYQKDSGKWRPFVYGGYALNLMISSSSFASFNDNTVDALGGSNTKISEGRSIDVTYKRKFLNHSLLLGGGIKYKIGKNYLYADARIMVGLNNLVIEDRNFYNADGTLSTPITVSQYVNDFFRLHNLSLSIGYIVPIYEPRKIQKASTKGFFRKLFKITPKT